MMRGVQVDTVMLLRHFDRGLPAPPSLEQRIQQIVAATPQEETLGLGDHAQVSRHGGHACIRFREVTGLARSASAADMTE